MKKAVTELTNDQKRIVNKLVDVADTDKLEAWLEEQHLWSAHAKLIRSLQSNDAKEDSLKLKIDIKEQAIIEAYDKYEKENQGSNNYVDTAQKQIPIPGSQSSYPSQQRNHSSTPIFDQFRQSQPRQQSEPKMGLWGRWGKKIELFIIIAFMVFILYVLFNVR